MFYSFKWGEGMNYCCNISIMMSWLYEGKNQIIICIKFKRGVEGLYRFQNIRIPTHYTLQYSIYCIYIARRSIDLPLKTLKKKKIQKYYLSILLKYFQVKFDGFFFCRRLLYQIGDRIFVKAHCLFFCQIFKQSRLISRTKSVYKNALLKCCYRHLLII